MRIAGTISSRWRNLERILRGLRARLCQRYALFAVLVVLTFGLGEPLLCIVHCQIWLPLAVQSHLAMHHHMQGHDHMHMMAMGTMDMGAMPMDSMSMPMDSMAMGAMATPAGAETPAKPSAPGQATLPPADPLAQPSCAIRGGAGQGSAPFHVPPSPVHDMLPAVPLLVCVLLLAGARRAAPPGDPPRAYFAPPLRPPILPPL